MKRLIMVHFLILGSIFASQLCRSGNFVVDPSAKVVIQDNGQLVPSGDTTEFIVNGGFETGSLPPWQTSNWQISAIQPHSGQYCAADVGNYWIRQDITPVLSDSITRITFWSRQPEAQIQAFDFMWDDNTYYENIVWVQTTWQQFDVTSHLPSGKTMIALRLWGYSGGPPQPDSTYTDDVSIIAASLTKIEEGTSRGQKSVLSIRPNPAQEHVMIEYATSPGSQTSLSIYDARGTLLKTVKLNRAEYTWNTDGFSPGVYFVRISAGSEKQYLRKVLIINR